MFVHDSCTWRTLFGGTGIFIYVLKVFLLEIRDQVVYIGRFVSFYTSFFISIRRYLAVNGILVAVKTCVPLCYGIMQSERWVPPLRNVYYLAAALKKEAVGCVLTKVGR